MSYNGHFLQVKSEKNVDKLSRMVAFRSLLTLLLLESFVEPGSTDDVAAELAICCSKAFPELPELSNIAPPVAVEGSEAPPVMDVLLDVLLSQLAKSSHPIREAVEKVSSLIRYILQLQHQYLCSLYSY